MRQFRIDRAAFSRACGTLIPLLCCPHRGSSADLSDSIRRAVVRGAQIADQADSVWQQVAGEVVPAWQRSQSLPSANVPPPFVEESFAAELLSVPLAVGAECAGLKPSQLEAQLPSARKEASLLYASAASRPINNEPFYGPSGQAPPGTAVRAFPAWLATAVEDGVSVGNSTVFGFESYVRWRVLSEALSDGRAPAERAKLQQCFSDRLGHALLQGPLAGVVSGRRLAGTPRPERALRQAVGDCDALLQLMKQRGLFTRAQLQLTLGSGTDLFDESDWQAGGSTSWQYIISGSAVVGASQLAQDRTAATGLGAGLYPGQLLTAPLAAYLSEANIVSRIDEYFLDNRVGRPDPRTFSDPRYYSDVLLEVVALEEGRM